MSVALPFTDIERAFLDRFRTQITAGGDGGPAVWTLEPNDPRDLAGQEGPVAVLSVQGTRDRVAYGGQTGAHNRTVGIAFVELYARGGSARSVVQAVQERIRIAFERQTHGGVTFRTARPGNGTGDRQSGYWRIVMHLPFYADDFV